MDRLGWAGLILRVSKVTWYLTCSLFNIRYAKGTTRMGGSALSTVNFTVPAIYYLSITAAVT